MAEWFVGHTVCWGSLQQSQKQDNSQVSAICVNDDYHYFLSCKASTFISRLAWFSFASIVKPEANM